MKLNTFLLVIILLLVTFCPRGSESIISSRVESVCPGEQLTLACVANHSAIQRWNVVLPEGNISRLIPFDGSITLQSFTSVVGVFFNFTRTSEKNRLPLISELLVDRVTVDMNGTEIHCIPSNESDPQITFFIHVLGANSLVHPLQVDKTEHHFVATNFTVTLNWTQEDSVSYNISIDPLTELVHLLNNTWQVIGNYNTVYNVSIVATLCERYNKTTNITLKYATCEFLTKESLGITDPLLKINNAGSNNPAIKGDSVTFYCLSGELMGQNTTTCLENGKWEPEPMATCNQVSNTVPCGPPLPPINGYILTNTNTLVTFVCQNQTQLHHETTITATCNNGVWEPNPRDHCTSTHSESKERSFEALSRDGKIAVASSVTVFTVTSILFYIIGFLSGHFCCKERKRDETVPPPSQEIRTPYYDDVVLKQRGDQQLELKDNVAYVSHTVTN